MNLLAMEWNAADGNKRKGYSALRRWAERRLMQKARRIYHVSITSDPFSTVHLNLRQPLKNVIWLVSHSPGIARPARRYLIRPCTSPSLHRPSRVLRFHRAPERRHK